jgi:polysaccharide export outer membrane protein
MRRIMIELVSILAGGFLLVCAAQRQPAAPSQQTQTPPVSLSPAMPVAGTVPVDPSKMAEPVGGKPVAKADVDVGTFILGAQDVIQVTMWDEPNFTGTFTIRPDGMIAMPLIGEIKATGLTPLQLSDAINKAALSQLKTPRSTVNVLAVHSKHAYFDGEGIAQPGAMDLVIPTRLLEAISQRGNFKEFANKNKITILRDGKKLMVVKYKDITSGKHPEENILLQDNDHVIVP